jgi:hypothetical protein
MIGKAWRLAGIAGLLLFLFFGDAPANTRFWGALFNAGHTALFGVIAVLLEGLWPASRARRPADQAATAFVVAVALGALTEVLQNFTGRDPSLEDLARDAAGAGAFLLLAGLRHRRAARQQAAAIVIALTLLVAAWWVLMRTSAAYLARDRAFPMLFAPAGTWWQPQFIHLGHSRLKLPAERIEGGRDGSTRVARLDLLPAAYPGIGLDEPYPDWRGYRQLVVTVVSDLPGPQPMAIRVHDARHDQRYADRFNRKLTIQPGLNRFAIPLDDIRLAPDRREMDLAHIRGVLLFAVGVRTPTHVYLGPLYLE